jgi:hypothetical protein
VSNPYPLPAPGAAQSVEQVNEQLRVMLERESAARIDARAVWAELAKVVMEGDKPSIKRLMLELLAALA